MARSLYHCFLHSTATIFTRLCILAQRFLCRDGYLLFDNLDGKSCESIDCFTLYEYLHRKGKRVKYLTTNASLARKHDGGRDGSIVYLKHDPMSIRGAVSLLPLGLRYRFVVTSHGRINFLWARVWRNSKYCVYIHSQHGVIFFKSRCFKTSITPADFDAVVVSNQLEQQLAVQSGWQKSHVFNTGLFRFDRLPTEAAGRSENRLLINILIMFTWRSGFDSTEEASRPIEDSLYYKRLLSLLTHPQLQGLIRSGKIRILFAAHHYFIDHGKGKIQIPENIDIVNTRDLSHYIRKANLLVTDYSSVCFDFLYQHKPVVFYKLDHDDTHLHAKDKDDQAHAKAVEHNIFNITYTEDEAVFLIEHYVNNGCALSDEHIKCADSFFSNKRSACQRFADKCSEYFSQAQ